MQSTTQQKQTNSSLNHLISFIRKLVVVSVGVPIKLLHEGEGHVVTVELKNGETYRGMLTEAEDSMNCQMKEGRIRLKIRRLSVTKD